MKGTALLVMDMQRAIVAGAPASLIAAARTAAHGARAADVPVVYIQVLLRPGRAGVSPRNKKLTRLHDVLTVGAPDLEIEDSIAPTPRDFVLTKHRVSSFAGSGLDVLLRSLDITHLVLCGVSTSTAVLSTALAAADLDFELTILSDACFNGAGMGLHDLLMSELFPTIATVTSAHEWVAALTGGVLRA